MNLYENIKAGSLKESEEMIPNVKVESQEIDESSLNSSTYTKIVRSIDDACAEEMDEKEIQLFLQHIIGYCRDTAESYNVFVESEDYYKMLTEGVYGFKDYSDEDLYYSEANTHALDLIGGLIKYYKGLLEAYKANSFQFQGLAVPESVPKVISDLESALNNARRAHGDFEESETLTEAPNPDNAEANELIKQALDDYRFAVMHKDDLAKYNIRVDEVYYDGTNSKGEKEIKSVHLTGPNGRKLKCKMWSYDSNNYHPDTQAYNKDGINKYNPETGTYENLKNLDNDFQLGTRSYKDSKAEINQMKSELPTLKKRLNLYERRYGKESTQYRDLVNQIAKYERTINKGIQVSYRGKVSNDTDFKNYLDSPLRADRPHALTPEEDPANKDVRDYKKAREEERYNNKQKDYNTQRDKEEQDRIASYMKDHTENKERRDKETSRVDAEIKAKLDEIHAKLEAKKAERKN